MNEIKYLEKELEVSFLVFFFFSGMERLNQKPTPFMEGNQALFHQTFGCQHEQLEPM